MSVFLSLIFFFHRTKCCWRKRQFATVREMDECLQKESNNFDYHYHSCSCFDCRYCNWCVQSSENLLKRLPLLLFVTTGLEFNIINMKKKLFKKNFSFILHLSPFHVESFHQLLCVCKILLNFCSSIKNGAITSRT